MDRYKELAQEYCGSWNKGLAPSLADFMREKFPEQAESLKSQIERLAAELHDRAGDGGESEGAVDCAIRVIREYKAKEPGLTEDQVCSLGAYLAKHYVVNVGRAKKRIRCWLKEHGGVKPEPGCCGECMQRPQKTLSCGSGKRAQFFCHKEYHWTTLDATCPRFQPKPDKFEELAREWCGSWHKHLAPSLADFLRERVTLREGT